MSITECGYSDVDDNVMLVTIMVIVLRCWLFCQCRLQKSQSCHHYKPSTESVTNINVDNQYIQSTRFNLQILFRIGQSVVSYQVNQSPFLL